MDAETFIKIIDSDFYAGVPDSLLSPLCDCLVDKYGVNVKNHIVAANEGNAVALAAGYYLSTGKIPTIYLQNSGEGNIINPVASLLSKDVYKIPAIFIVGYRGEPGIHDEPQHIFQGKVTLKLLEDMDIDYFIVNDKTTVEELSNVRKIFEDKLKDGGQVAFVIGKGALTNEKKYVYNNNFTIIREEAIKAIADVAGDDIIVATTGKIGRELYEIREQRKESHERDFLTVGSMGHASSIALGIALNAPMSRIWCIDGDGAAIMHMGSMATIGAMKPRNLIHVIINNAAHESVGGMPTAQPDFCGIAKACGYESVLKITERSAMNEILPYFLKKNKNLFVEICCKLESRRNLGRPNEMPAANKMLFMQGLHRKGR